jgi:hypothetical protein
MCRAYIWTVAGWLLMMTSVSSAGDRKLWPSKYAVVEMPVSLAMGSIRTPEFPVDGQWYDVVIQIEKPPSLSFHEENCMLGTTLVPPEKAGCQKAEPLVQANWAVCEYDAEQCHIGLPPQPLHGTLMHRVPGIISRGSLSNDCSCKFADKQIYRQLSSFPTQAGKKYVVEVRFTSDASALNIANPHLLIIRHKDFW